LPGFLPLSSTAPRMPVRTGCSVDGGNRQSACMATPGKKTTSAVIPAESAPAWCRPGKPGSSAMDGRPRGWQGVLLVHYFAGISHHLRINRTISPTAKPRIETPDLREDLRSRKQLTRCAYRLCSGFHTVAALLACRGRPPDADGCSSNSRPKSRPGVCHNFL
jgi:hypothetical protein